MYALVDCNNFYVSCERVFQPQYNGKPVIVLSNNDGCAIARSEEAKALGIEMGAPLHIIESKIKQQVKIFSSNYTLYGDMSSRVMYVLSGFAEHIENYSIDESFLYVGDMGNHNLDKHELEIKQKIKQWTGIPVSVGIAPSKTLAKLANRYAKKTIREIGVYALDTKEKIDDVLKWASVGDIWGIGKQYEKKLNAIGVMSAYDLTQQNDEWVRKNMSVVGKRMIYELRGKPTIELEEVAPAKKGICTSRSFGKLITDIEEVKQALANFASKVAFKLRKQNCCTGVIQVFLHTNQFRMQDSQLHRQITWQIPTATNNTNQLIEHAVQAIDKLFLPGYNYHKVGIIAIEIVPVDQVQSSLWDVADKQKNSTIMRTLDSINKGMGEEVVKFSRQGYNKKWKLRAEFLSKCYTTRLDHILRIKD